MIIRRLVTMEAVLWNIYRIGGSREGWCRVFVRCTYRGVWLIVELLPIILFYLVILCDIYNHSVCGLGERNSVISLVALPVYGYNVSKKLLTRCWLNLHINWHKLKLLDGFVKKLFIIITFYWISIDIVWPLWLLITMYIDFILWIFF